jgi:hypothetical protein
MSSVFNFVFTSGGPYGVEYANKTYHMMSRHAGMPFKAYCISDPQAGLHPEIELIAPEMQVKGWWNKVLGFSKQMPAGWIVMLDVDILIVNSLKPVLEYAFTHTKQIAAYADAIHWMDCKFSSSLMIFRSGELVYIYDEFKRQYPAIENRPGGDQVWIAPYLQDVLYLDEVFPKFKKSLKFELGEVNGNELTLPKQLDPDIVLVDFHGKPKPHEILQVPFVQAHWR